ncbi:MAG TPA: hypothetical protein VFQ67_08540 [Allosphingosinicella sp.]|nr:hypothetical protein [Allosphingosinicella sp.]
MSRRRTWLLALVAALVVAFATMMILKTNTDPAPGEPGGSGNVVGTSGAVLILLILAAASARRRRRREKDERDDG